MTQTPDHHKATDIHKASDIHLRGWLAALPRPLHPYLILGRLDRPIGWWLLLLPGWFVLAWRTSEPAGAAYLMILFWVGAVVMRAAGCVINDVWDRDIDKKIARTASRPLASGAVSVLQALMYLAILSVIGLGVLLQLPLAAWIAGIASLPLVVVYPLAKRITGWPQIVLGLTFSWGALLAEVALYEQMPSWPVWLFYLGCVFWVIGYDTIYAVQDMADDRKTGVRSSALSLGAYLIPGVASFYAIGWMIWGLAFYLQGGFQTGWLIGWLGAGCHCIWQCRLLGGADPVIALRLFKSNRDLGLILTAGLMLDWWL